MSEVSRMVSSSVSRFSRFLAETWTISVSPPHSTGLQSVLRQFLLDAIRIGVGLVDLVDGDDDRHACRARVFDGFDRLRHDAVVGRDDQHDHVGRFRAARAHHRERFVTGRVEKHDAARFVRIVRTRHLHAVGADVLRDAAGFAGGDVRLRECRRAAKSCRDRRGP